MTIIIFKAMITDVSVLKFFKQLLFHRPYLLSSSFEYFRKLKNFCFLKKLLICWMFLFIEPDLFMIFHDKWL